MNENKAKLIYALQKYYIIMQSKGVKIMNIYLQIIKLYPMSISTFYRYMGISVRLVIKEIDKEELQKFTENVIKNLQSIANEAYGNTGSEIDRLV